MQEERIGSARRASNVSVASIVRSVTKEEIAEELFAAIKEYFIGECGLRGSEISLELFSGERFTVSVA